MDLRDRLRRIRPGVANPSGKSNADGIPHRANGSERLEKTLDGSCRQGRWGSWFEVHREYPSEFRQGGIELSSLRSLHGSAVALLSGERELPFHPEEILFLDTETTGLSWGAGTIVFLVGVGFFSADRYHVRQLFLTDPSSERALLEALAELLSGEVSSRPFRLLVTFNGKSFDLNVLENRFILCRLASPLRRMPHLDLLHAGRRLWRGSFEDCALQTLERRLLGLHRSGDVPSSLIPRTYFEYLHHGRVGPFRSVFRHNRQDILSLALLLSLAARQVLDPAPEYGVDPLAAARLHSLRGHPEGALRILEKAWRRGHKNSASILLELALLKRRQNRPLEALQVLQTLLDEEPDPPLEAFVETAKLLEHRVRDLKQALRVVQAGMERYARSEDLHHRRHRLESRLEGRRWY